MELAALSNVKEIFRGPLIQATRNFLGKEQRLG